MTQSDASDSGPGPRLPGSRNTAGAGAGHGSRHWQLAWKLSWLLTADCYCAVISFHLIPDVGRQHGTLTALDHCHQVTIGLGPACAYFPPLLINVWMSCSSPCHRDMMMALTWEETKENNVRKITETVYTENSCLITEEWGGCTGIVCTIRNFFLSLIWPLPHRVSAAADLHCTLLIAETCRLRLQGTAGCRLKRHLLNGCHAVNSDSDGAPRIVGAVQLHSNIFIGNVNIYFSNMI